MDISGSYTFNAPPDRVWNLLMDPAVIAACIPGCDRFEPDGDDGEMFFTNVFSYSSRQRVCEHAFRATLADLRARRAELAPVLAAHGLSLRPAGEATIVDVSGTVQTGGPIARVGQRLIGGVSKMMLDRFFSCLQSKLGA